MALVQLAWRNLVQNRTQFALSVGGVVLAMLLMLALDALLAGTEDDLVAYIEQSGADIFVAQENVRNMHMAASAITWRDLRIASHAEGVVNASPILYTTSIVKAGGEDVLSYIIGYDPDMPLGGPSQVIAGTTDLQRDEAIIDQTVARRQGLGIGDEVEIFGHTFTIAGLTRGLTNIVNTVTFIRLQDFAEVRRANTVSYALLTVTPEVDANLVAAAIMARNNGLTALPRAEFARQERRIIKDMSVEILNIMNAAGLLIGLAVTALTLYINSLRKAREYGVLKAIGAGNRDLYLVVSAQAVISLTIGFAGALVLAWSLGQVLPLVTPGMGMRLTRTGVTRMLLASLLMGTVAALAPAWQLAHLDPAQVFRG